MSLDPAHPGELREDDHYTTALYRAAIGPVNGAYYLPLFVQWELTHQLKTRWNWAAGLATLDWLIFRKMGLYALAYGGAVVASVLLLFGLGAAWTGFSSPALWGLAGTMGLIAVLVPGLLGNRWFHAACSKKMTVALQAHADVPQACEALGQQASQRRRGLVIAGVHTIALLALGLTAAQFVEFNQQAGPRPNPDATIPSPQMASGRVVQAGNLPASAPTPIPARAPALSALAISAVASAPKAAASRAQAPASKPQTVVAVAASSPTAKAPAMTVKASAGFLVNVGLFAVASNAKAAQEKLEGQNLPVITDTLSMPRGPRTRVRCGPFDTKEQAQAAAIKIRALGLDAILAEP